MKKITRKLLPYFFGLLSILAFGQNNLNSQVFVGVIKAADPDTGQTLTFRISSGNSENFFTVHPTNGTLSVNPSAFDTFFAQRTWILSITATDSDKLKPQSTTASIQVTLKRDALSGKMVSEIAKGD
jgi:hypothetical protein